MKSYYFKKVFFIALFCGLFFFGNNVCFASSKEGSSEKKEALPKDVEQLDFANGLFERGLYRMSAKEYEKFIHAFPESEFRIEAYYGAPESLFFAKSYKKAIEKYKRYVEFFSDKDKVCIAKLRIGQSYFLVEKFDDAIEIMLSIDIQKLDENFKQILYYYLGKAYKEKGNKELSLLNYRLATEVPGKSSYVTQSFFDMGDIYQQDDDFSLAIEVYSRANVFANTDKIKSQALFKQGELQFLAKDYKSSINTFREIIRDYPEEEVSKDALSNLLSALFNSLKYQELLTEYQNNANLIIKESNFFDVSFIAARAYLHLGIYEETLKILNEILSLSKLKKNKQGQVLLVKVETLVKAKHFKDAIVLIKANPFLLSDNKDQILFWRAESNYGLEKYEKAFELYKKIIDENSDSTLVDEALYSMAFTKKFMGRGMQAVELFLKYYREGKDENRKKEALYNAILMEVKLELTDRIIEHGEIYLSQYGKDERAKKVLYLLGTLYSEKKEHDKAIEILKECEELKETARGIENVCFLLAHNFQMQENFKEALEYYEKVSLEDSSEELVYSSLKNSALIHSKLKNYDSAAKMFERIINEYEDNDLDVEIYIWLAKHQLKEKKYVEAVNVLAKAKNVAGAEKKEGIIAFFCAEALSQQREFDKAIENYNIALLKEESIEYQGAAYLGKGCCFKEKGEHGLAQKEFEIAITENVDDNTITMKARFELANVKKLSGNLEEAIKFYLLVAVLYDDNLYCPKALYSAGEVFEMLKSNGEALKVYQEILDKYENSDFYSKAEERIKILGES